MGNVKGIIQRRMRMPGAPGFIARLVSGVLLITALLFGLIVLFPTSVATTPFAFVHKAHSVQRGLASWMALYDYFCAPLPASVFVWLIWIQYRHPLRRQRFAVLRRVARNLVFAVPSFLTLRLLLLPVPLTAALWAENHHFGLMHWLHVYR
ncbi:MAG TPA: hypothetical protein VF600_05890 [Abditibacteriaceae bacterium]